MLLLLSSLLLFLRAPAKLQASVVVMLLLLSSLLLRTRLLFCLLRLFLQCVLALAALALLAVPDARQSNALPVP